MKYKILFVLLFTVFLIQAQEKHFGIKGGLNLSDITNNKELESRIGFVIGGFVKGSFSDKVGIQLEVLLSLQGANSKIDRDRIDLLYLNLPLAFKYYFFKPLYFELGPQLGVELTNDLSNSTEALTYIRTLDISGIVGFGYEFSKDIFLEFRYNYGLREAVFRTEALLGSPPKVEISPGRNSVCSLTLGYTLL